MPPQVFLTAQSVERVFSVEKLLFLHPDDSILSQTDKDQWAHRVIKMPKTQKAVLHKESSSFVFSMKFKAPHILKNNKSICAHITWFILSSNILFSIHSFVIFWTHSDDPKIDNKVYVESGGGVSY